MGETPKKKRRRSVGKAEARDAAATPAKRRRSETVSSPIGGKPEAQEQRLTLEELQRRLRSGAVEVQEKLRLAEALAAADAPWGLSRGRRSALALQWLTSSLVAAQKGRHSAGLHLLPAAWRLLALLLTTQAREERRGESGESAAVALTVVPPQVHEALAAHVRHWTPALSSPSLQWPPMFEAKASKSNESDAEREEREIESSNALEAASEVAEALELARAGGGLEATAALASSALSAATEALQDTERRKERRRGSEAAARLARRALAAFAATASRQATGSRRPFSAAVDGLLPAVLQLSLHAQERRWRLDNGNEKSQRAKGDKSSATEVKKRERERDVDAMDVDDSADDSGERTAEKRAGGEAVGEEERVAMEDEEELLAAAATAVRASLFDGAPTADFALVLSGTAGGDGAYAGTGIRSYQRKLFSRLLALAKDQETAAATLAAIPLLLQCFTAAHSSQQEARAAHARAKEMASRASNSNSAAALASDSELLEMRFLLELHSISVAAVEAAPEGEEREGAKKRALAAAQTMLCCLSPHQLPQARAGRAPVASSSPLSPILSLLNSVADCESHSDSDSGRRIDSESHRGIERAAARELACDTASQLLRLEHGLILSRPELLWALLEPLESGESTRETERAQASLMRRYLAVHLLLRQTEKFLTSVLEAADKSRPLTASLLSGRLPLLQMLQSAARRLPVGQLSPLLRLTARHLTTTAENVRGGRELAAALIESLAAGASCTEASAVALEAALGSVCEALLPILSSTVSSALLGDSIETAEAREKREKREAKKRKREDKKRAKGKARESLESVAGVSLEREIAADSLSLTAGEAAAVVGASLSVRCLLQECKVAQATDKGPESEAEEFFSPLVKDGSDGVTPQLSPLLEAAAAALKRESESLRGDEERAKLHLRILHCAVRAAAELQLCHAPSTAALALTSTPVAQCASALALAWLPLVESERERDSEEEAAASSHVRSAAHCLTTALPQLAPLLPPSAVFRLCLFALSADDRVSTGERSCDNSHTVSHRTTHTLIQRPWYEAAERGGRCKGLREAAALALTLPLLEAAAKLPGAPVALSQTTAALREVATTAVAQSELESALHLAAKAVVLSSKTAKKKKRERGRERGDGDGDVEMEEADDTEIWEGLEGRLALLATSPAHSLPPTVASAVAMAVAHVAEAARAESPNHSDNRRRCLLLAHAWAARHTCDSFSLSPLSSSQVRAREGAAGDAAAAEVLLCAQAFGEESDGERDSEGVCGAARASARALAQRKLSRWLSLAAEGEGSTAAAAAAEITAYLARASASHDSSGALALSAALSASQALLEGRECRAAASARQQRREARALLMRREEKALVSRFQRTESQTEAEESDNDDDDDEDSDEDASEREGEASDVEAEKEKGERKKGKGNFAEKEREKETAPEVWLRPLEATALWLSTGEQWKSVWRLRLCARLLRCFRAAHARIWRCDSPSPLPLPMAALEASVAALEALASDVKKRQKRKSREESTEEDHSKEMPVGKSLSASERKREERGVAGAAVAEALAACAFLAPARASLASLGPRLLSSSLLCLESESESESFSGRRSARGNGRERERGERRRDSKAAVAAAEGLLARLLAAADLRLSSSALAASLAALASGSAAEAAAGATCAGLLAARAQGRAARHLDARGTEVALALAAALRRHPRAPVLSQAALSAATALLAAKRRLPLGPRAVAATLHVASAALTASQRRLEWGGDIIGDIDGDIGDVARLLQTAVKHRRPESGRAVAALLMATRALLWSAAHGGSSGWRAAARVLQCLAAAGGLARRHAGPLVAEALAVLQARAVPQEARRELRLGLFPLLDLCSSLDLQALFAGLDNTGKAIFQELHAAHSKLHHFRGKA